MEMFKENVWCAIFLLCIACLLFLLVRRGGVVGWSSGAVLALFGLIIVPAPNHYHRLNELYFMLLIVGGLSLYAKVGFFRFALIEALVAAILVIATGTEGQWIWSAARTQFPFESMTERLAYEMPCEAVAVGGETVQLQDYQRRLAQFNKEPDAQLSDSPVSAPPINSLDELYAKASIDGGPGRRYLALRSIHASYVEQFLASPGFGIGRVMMLTPRTAENDRAEVDANWKPGLSAVESLVQVAPDEYLPPGFSPPAAPNSNAAWQYHTTGLTHFIDLQDFGYIRDREHVAGFRSHGFRDQRLGAIERWDTIRVELVSLLKHDEPVVYVSEQLPQMSELASAPVRPLDEFERNSLTALEQGGELQTELVHPQLRMFGAIRAARQCLDCHSVKHGALLGAFSYVLRPEVPPAPAVGPRATAAHIRN